VARSWLGRGNDPASRSKVSQQHPDRKCQSEYKSLIDINISDLAPSCGKGHRTKPKTAAGTPHERQSREVYDLNCLLPMELAYAPVHRMVEDRQPERS
jgi:hypothetical protein